MRRLFLIAVCGLIALSAAFLFSSLAPSSSAQNGSRQSREVSQDEFRTGKRMTADKRVIQRLQERARGAAKISVNEATGAVNFIRLTNLKNNELIAAPAAVGVREKSDAFFNEYGSVFGIADTQAELRMENENADALGGTHQTFQQFYKGVPVFAGSLKTHYNRENKLYAVNGTFVPEISIDVNPVFNGNEAAETAINKVAEEKGTYGLFTKGEELYVYRSGLIQGVPGNDYLAWKIEVTNNNNVREYVFVDARTNKIIDQFTGIHDALDRRAYNGNGVTSEAGTSAFYPSTPFWIETNAFPTGNAEANNMLLASKETYDLFMTGFGRDSYNATGIKMDSIFNRGYGCPNASWNGTFISFCSGLTTDDVTAHEWGHAYTEYTHNLIYAWQPGALNESYSDIIGETVDRINNRDTLGNSATNPARTTGNCSSGSTDTRWLLGEDSTAVGLTGALRDMYNPSCFGDPGKVSDASYVCSTADGGGVHTNSGVPNHAYALIVDGGTYNGQTINGIGLTKAAHIYFRAMNVYQKLDSGFVDHANAVEQSATDLMNSATNLKDLVTGAPSGQFITAGDIAEVQKAMLAVQMRTAPTQCNFQPLLGKTPPTAAACAVGTTRTDIFVNDFEGNTSNWTIGKLNTGGTFVLPDWTVSGTLPDGVAGKGFYAANPDVGTCTAASDQSGVRFLQSPVIQVPAGSVTSPTLSFDHWISTESRYDGGQIMYSVNNGPFTLVPATNFTYNAHNTTLNTSGNSNPRFGQRAWTGADGGSVRGSWGKTIVNLTGLAVPGQSIQFRWDMSTDGCGGRLGWYVDNVNFNACLVSVPTAASVTIRGRVVANRQALSRATVELTDSSGQVRSTTTDRRGYYQFDEVESGRSYTVSVKARTYIFTPQTITPFENVDNLNFVASAR